MFKVTIGHSDDIKSIDAIENAIKQCTIEMKDNKPQSCILFASINYEHQILIDKLNKDFPGIELIGCTTDGEISSVNDFMEDSVSLLLFYSDQIEIKAGIGREVSKDPVLAAKKAVNQAKDKCIKESKLCITTPESLTASCVTILDGLKSVLGDTFPIVGGTAGDQWRFKRTFQFYKNEILVDSVPILLFAGDLLFSFGAESGWTPIGKKSKVTKAESNIVFEIDEQPALDFYKHYLGDVSDSTLIGMHPLAVQEAGSDRVYLRASWSFDESIGAVIFAGDVPQDATIQITETIRDSVIAAANTSATNAFKDYPGNNPEAVLLFSCAARKQILGTRTKEEFLSIKSNISKELTICGFYTYGEICPLSCNTPTVFHNETFITLLLGTE